MGDRLLNAAGSPYSVLQHRSPPCTSVGHLMASTLSSNCPPALARSAAPAQPDTSPKQELPDQRPDPWLINAFPWVKAWGGFCVAATLSVSLLRPFHSVVKLGKAVFVNYAELYYFNGLWTFLD